MDEIDPAKLTIGELIGRLKTGQLYAVVGAILAMVFGAFAAGTYLSNYKAERAASEVAQARETAELARSTLAKANINLEFFTKFLRYAITKKQTEEDGYLRFEAAHREAKAAFTSLIKTWYNDQNKVGAQFSLTPHIHKSYDPAQPNVVLPDQSQWPIPYEIKKEVLGLP